MDTNTKQEGVIPVAMCPICNAFRELEMNCSTCNAQLEDMGKVSDYLDPYGHYNDVDTVKMGDGYMHTIEEQTCPHLMYCKNCDRNEVTFIQEV